MQTNGDDSFLLELGIKIAGFFVSFVGGIVTATWVVASKMKGIDDRLKSVEAMQNKCQNNTLARIDDKLDSIHRRIDEILIRGKE